MRSSWLDKIPQLCNVFRGDMTFVGLRQQPEFVQWLTQEIPCHQLRHTFAPGITGWAQVCCKYGNSLEDSKEKLENDLYYVKNLPFGLDVLVLFQTIKTVLLSRGAQ